MAKMYFYNRVRNNFFSGLFYFSNKAISFNEGGKYFNFHLSWKPLFFYLYASKFRISIHTNKPHVKFDWLGV